uniref:G-protein coupled receptors family 1 profile domain-containing protein n=1 Tax=Romanomermis culicivorax TaxID=13658 RepID=A0A915HXW8_ROMCU
MRWLNFNTTQSNSSYSEIFCFYREISWKWTSISVLDFALTGPLLTLIILGGLFGNISTAVIFYRTLSRMSINLHLLALTCFDLIYIISAFFIYNLPTLIYLEIPFFGRQVFAYPIFYYVSTVARTCSIWTVIFVATERFVSLCYPFAFDSQNANFRIRITLTSITAFSVLYNSVRYFEISIKYCRLPGEGEEKRLEYVPIIRTTIMRNNYVYWLVYRVIGSSATHSIIPFVILLFLTIRIFVEIRKSYILSQWSDSNDFSGPNCLITFPNSKFYRNLHVTKNTDYGSKPVMNNSSRLAYRSDTVNLHGHQSSLLSNIFQQQKQQLHHKRPSICSRIEQRNKRNKRMHICMITKFLLCHIFPTLVDVWEFAFHSSNEMGLGKNDQSADLLRAGTSEIFVNTAGARLSLELMSHFSMLLVTLNSSCNFFIYLITSPRFRKDCKYMFHYRH